MNQPTKLIKTKAVVQIILMLTLTILTAFTITPEVVYANESSVCCSETISGEYCQTTTTDQCAPGITPFYGPCELSSECRVGCCDLGEDSTGCMSSVPQTTCENSGGTFLADPSCESYAQCDKGCLVIGSNCDYVTERQANQILEEYPDVEKDYRPVESEYECSQICLDLEKGCCSYEDSCINDQRGNCESTGGAFYNEFCSAVNSPSCNRCETQSEKKCVEGSTDVYWFDSCGNQEQVAEGCDYQQGFSCGEVNGEITCKDLNCQETWDNPAVDENYDGIYDNDGGFRYNGESWCEYDGNIGPGVDLPGSRHFVHSCQNGKEVVNECADYRDEICIGGRIELDDGKLMSSAGCIDNNVQVGAIPCGSCENKNCCQNTPGIFCLWLGNNEEDLNKYVENERKSIEEGGNFSEGDSLDVKINNEAGECIPVVAPGTQFWKEDSKNCNNADLGYDGWRDPAKAYWIKPTGEPWNCVGGCLSYTKQFIDNRNVACSAQGDCGASYNLAGVWSNQGLQRDCTSEAEGISDVKTDFTWTSSDEPNGGEIKDKNYLLEIYGSDKISQGKNKVIGLLNDCTNYVEDPNNFDLVWGSYDGKLDLGIISIKEVISQFQDIENTKNFFTYGALGGAIIFNIALILTAGAATGTAVTSIGSAATAVQSLLTGATSAGTAGPVGWIVSVIIIIITVIILLVSSQYVNYEAPIGVDCKPWVAPEGGDYCNLCYEPGENTYGKNIDLTANGLHSCTEYTCKSLGSYCEFIPDTPSGPKCVAKEPLDSSSTKISALNKITEVDHCTSSEQSNNQQECTLSETTNTGYTIEPFMLANTKITLGVKTDKLATCKFSNDPNKLYEEMTDHFEFSGNAIEHNITLIPNTNFQNGEEYSYYVRCKNAENDKINDRPYTISFTVANAPDLTTPSIESYFPENNGKVAHSLNETPVEITISEKVYPNTCKWSRSDQYFETMPNSFYCSNPPHFTEQTCKDTFTNITDGLNKFFIRCQDASENENINKESFIYTFTKTQPLNIDLIKCKSEFGETCDRIYSNNFTIEVFTSSGANNGNSICKYGQTSNPSIEFYSDITPTNIHKQTLGPNLPTGQQKYYINCEDEAGNIDSKNITIDISPDRSAPKIKTYSIESGVLILTTDEDATCKYSNNNTLNFANAKVFSVTNTKIHKETVNDKYFKVMCSDQFGNIMLPLNIFIK